MELTERKKYIITRYKEIQKEICHIQIEKENHVPIPKEKPKVAPVDEDTRKRLAAWKKEKQLKEMQEKELAMTKELHDKKS